MTAERSSPGVWRTYRCPVCSHSDDVSLAGADSVMIRCSHCDTPLEVRRKGADSVAVTVSESGSGGGGKQAS